MIETSLSRVKIHEVVQSQIPASIDAENPDFGEFLKQYYISQEFQGGSIDIAENLVEYKGLDFLNNENLIGFTSTTSYSDGAEKTIEVLSTKGWPQKYGLLKINDEIITYTGITTNSFVGCTRGFSGIENNIKTNQPEYLTFSTSGVGTHDTGVRVENLSNVFLTQFLKKLKKQVLPGFSERPLHGRVDQSNFIRQAKDFYRSKGTEEAFKILFGALYGETVEMIQPAKFMIRPSAADYIVNDVIIAKGISGDALKISGESLEQNTSPTKTEGSIYNVESVIVGLSTYYSIAISENTTFGEFKQTNKTFATIEAPLGAVSIFVDSTVGFGTTGFINIDSQNLYYSGKSYTKFDLTLPTASAIPIGSTITQGINARSYENGDLNFPVELEIVGSLSGFNGEAVNQQELSDINIKTLGVEQDDRRWSSWIYNTAVSYGVLEFTSNGANNYNIKLDSNHVLFANDSIQILDLDNNVIPGTITAVISDDSITVACSTLTPQTLYKIRRNLKINQQVIADVQNTYSDPHSSVFVASNSIPHWNISPSKRIRTFFTPNSATNIIDITDHNLSDGDQVVYENVLGTELTNLSEGESYIVKRINDSQIALAFTPENVRSGQYIQVFSTADIGASSAGKLTPTIFYGTELGAQKLLRKFNTPEFPSTSAVKTTQGGVGMFVNGVEIYSYKATDKLFYGSLQSVTVLNRGHGYDVINPPRLSVAQAGHTGVGASCIPQMKGTLQEVLVDADDTVGLDYVEVPTVSILGGNHKDVVARAKMKTVPQVIDFDSTTTGGVVNTSTDTFLFAKPHGFANGEEVIYTTNGTSNIGIGTTPGTLIDSSSYFVKKTNDFSFRLTETKSNALAENVDIIIPITGSGGGIQRFTSVRRRSRVDEILIEGEGSFHNREITTISGINTFTNTIHIDDHGFNSGDVVVYSSDVAPAGGLTNNSQYFTSKVSDDSFQLTTDRDNKNIISILSAGTGSQIFKDPEIQITISGRQGISTSNTTATPIVRGTVERVFVTNPGTDFGSTVINDNFKPEVNTVIGKEAFLQPFIVNGRIDQIIIKSGGKDFFSTPDIIITGDGVGAKAKAIISNGQITSIEMIDKGGNYTQSQTIVAAKTPGGDAIYSANLNEWVVNQVDRYARFGDVSADDGFYEVAKDSSLGNPYVNYYAPRNLRNYLQDLGNTHSPILGWAYDGNPIYGPVGFSNPNGTGLLAYMKSSYAKLSTQRTNGPSIVDYPAGFFVEDYTYTPGFGDLDEHNGRFTVTPEYPNGVYAYFVTVTNNQISNPSSPFNNGREPIFPYVVGDSYRSQPEVLNLGFNFDQNIDPLKYNLVRNTKNYNINSYDFVSNSQKNTFVQSRIVSTKSGGITSLEIIDGGNEYGVGDRVVFDNSDTDGFGAIARVSEISGPIISSFTSTINKFPDTTFVYTGGKVTGITTVPHNLVTGTTLRVDDVSSTLHKELEGRHTVTVSSARSGLTTAMNALGANGGITTSIKLSDDPGKYEIDDILRIDNEQFLVYGISITRNEIDLIRAQNGTAGVAHTNGARIDRLERKFTFGLESCDSTPTDERIYFDATSQLGIGASIGQGEVHTITDQRILGAGGSRSIPKGSIFLPNHPFSNGEKIAYNYDNSTAIQYLTAGVGTASGWSASLPETLFVQVIDNNLVGVVTMQNQISSSSNRALFYSNIGIGNTHSFKSVRGEITGNIQITDVTATTKDPHTLRPGDEIDMNIVSTGTSSIALTYNPGNRFVSIGSSTNPKVTVIEGDLLEFDMADASLVNTKLGFYLDQSYQKSFVGSGKSNIEVLYSGAPGSAGAKASVHFTPEIPRTLFYKLESFDNTKIIEIDDSIDDYTKIVVTQSDFTTKSSVSSTTNDTFKFNIFENPERVGYTSVTADINYNTTSKNEKGPIAKVRLVSQGARYKDLPQVTIGSTTGTSALLRASGSNIGKLDTVELIQSGYDYPSDKTLRPEAEMPQVIFLKDNFTVSNVAITSTGKNYLIGPDLIIYNTKKNEVSSNTEIKAELLGSSVSGVRIISGGNNLSSGDNKMVAINNSNGVGIVTVAYSAPNVIVTLKTPNTGFTATNIPFAIGDNVFVENVGVTSGHGYNSSTFGFDTFTLTAVDPAVGLIDKATITYEVPVDPGIYDLGTFGTVSNDKDIAKFEVTLEEGNFFKGEKIINKSNSKTSKIVSGQGKTRNVIRVNDVDGFQVGDSVTAELSGAGGTIENIETFTGNFDVDVVFKKRFGWEDSVGQLSNFYQRIQDSDYYQSFAYSLKSTVGISSWSEPVDALAHIAGFKKHSDLLIPSQSTGIGQTSIVSVGVGTISKSVVLIDTEDSLSNIHNFDLVYEEPNSTNTLSDKIIFNSARFGSSLICKSNRVLEIDDISPQFYDDPNLIKTVAIDEFDTASPNSPVAVKYYAQVVLDSSLGISYNATQYCEFAVFTDGTDAYINQYSDLSDAFDLGEFIVNQNGSIVEVSFEPYNNTYTYDITFYKEGVLNTVGSGSTSYANIEKIGISSAFSAIGSPSTYTIQDIDASNFKSGTILVVHSSNSETDLEEYNFLADGTGGVLFSDYGNMDSGSTLGDFDIVQNSGVLKLQYTPAANQAVTIRTLTTSVGVATTAGLNVSDITKLDVGDAELNADRTEIAATATPSAVIVSSKDYTNYTSVKYFIEVHNTTDNVYSSFNVSANAFAGYSNYNVYNNLSNATDIKRDIRAIDINISGNNMRLRFTPLANKDYIVRVSEIRIDKPDNVANDTTITI